MISAVSINDDYIVILKKLSLKFTNVRFVIFKDLNRVPHIRQEFLIAIQWFIE